MMRIALAIAALTVVAYPLVDGCHIDPVKASWSGKVWPTAPQGGVGQGLTCNFDLPVWASYFTGTATSEQYQVQLKFPGENGVDSPQRRLTII